MQSTNHRLVLIDMNLAPNAFFIDILCEEGVLKFIVCVDYGLRVLLYIQQLTSTR